VRRRAALWCPLSRDPGLIHQFREGGQQYLHLVVRRRAALWCPLSRDNPGLAAQDGGGRTTVLTSGREEAGRAVVPPCPVTTLGLPRRTEGRMPLGPPLVSAPIVMTVTAGSPADWVRLCGPSGLK
jgi:hypothetical protein